MQVFNYGGMAANAIDNFGQGLNQMRERQSQEQMVQQQKDALNQAAQLYSTGTPDEIAQFSIQNPQAGELLSKQLAFKSDATRQNMMDSMQQILLDPSQAESVLTNRIKMIQEQGGDPSQTMAELEQFRTNPEGYEQKVERAYAMMDPQGYGAYRSSMPQQQAPNYSNVQFDEAGNPYGLNKTTGKYEPIQGGFQRAKPTPQTIVNMGKAESEQAKTIAKAEGENYNAYVNEAKVARTNDSTLNRLESLNEKAFDGVTAPAYKAASKLAESVGINIGGLTETQLFDSLANQLVLGQTSKLTGVLTDKDMELLASTVPQLSQTKEGRKQLIGIMKEMNSATKDKARLAAKFRKENGGQFDDMAFQDWLETQPKKDRFSKFASSKPSQPVIQAPQGALDYLKANPSMANQFKAKYGYLPEGY